MRVLFHHRTISKDGQRVHIEEIVRAFRELGHDVIVVEPPQASAGEGGDDGGGLISWMRRRLPAATYELLELAYSVPAFYRLWRAYRHHRPDLVYERYNLFLLTGLWLKRLTGVPLVLEINSPLTDERLAYGNLRLAGLARRTDRWTWRAADLVLPVTDVLADYVRGAGVAEGRVLVTPNGIDPQRFPPDLDGAEVRDRLGLDGRIVMGFTGFVRAWHGLDQVVGLLPEHPKLHLLIVGDGPARPDLEAQAESLGVRERLTCIGVVPHDAVAAHLAAFDIALQSASTPWASPLKLFEYMAAGCAIIAPDQPNLREVLVDEETALLFETGSTDPLRAAIHRLVVDAALRNRLGSNAQRAIVERGFTWRTSAQRILATLDHAAEAERDR